MEGLPEMWADADRLEQIFFNLIENASEARRPATSTVTVERETGWVVSRSTTRATA